MQSSIRQNSVPSFDYRLMKGIQEAMPATKASIEINNPSFSGRIITIWDEETDSSIHYRLPDSVINQWDTTNESLYIAMVVTQLRAACKEKKENDLNQGAFL